MISFDTVKPEFCIRKYRPFNQIRDFHPVRATCFHPQGHVYVVGSNSKKLWICGYPSKDNLKNVSDDEGDLDEPEVLYQLVQTHRGSIYCASFNRSGTLLATGSNDQTVHVIRYNASKNVPEGAEYKLTMHDGTVRDLCFLGSGNEQQQQQQQQVKCNNSTSSSVSHFGGGGGGAPYSGRISPVPSTTTSDQLISAGAGDCKIYLTDCSSMKSRQMFRGHDSTIMSVHQWGNANLFVSGSSDGSIRLWDIRMRHAALIVNAKTSPNTVNGVGTDGSILESKRRTSTTTTAKTAKSFHTVNMKSGGGGGAAGAGGGDENEPVDDGVGQKSCGVGVVRVESSGRLMVSGHQDGQCMFHDLRGGKLLQKTKLHDAEIRTVNFSPNSYYLLTGGYDGKLKLLDLQGDLREKLPLVELAELSDKVVQTAWHPSDYNFVVTSADGSATLWTISEFG